MKKTPKKSASSKKPDDTECSACHTTPKESPSIDFIKDSDGDVTLCQNCIDSFSAAKKEITNLRTQVGASNEVVVNESLPLPTPEEIFKHLSDYVIGQDSAKKSLSIAVAHHYRRLRDASIGKSNILLIGPTGTGKTELGRSIANYLKVAFVSADATSFTTKGYVGEDVDSVIARLLMTCNWDVKAAEKGIVFIDEIDKLSRKGGSEATIGTVAVQQGLLRLMEGDEIKINKPNPDMPNGVEPIFINTSHILFICAGAFVGLADQVKSNSSSRPLGFSNQVTTKITDDNWMEHLEAKHLVSYGMIPELLGRLPVVTVTKLLTKDDLVRIMKESKNSITHQYENLFKQDGVAVEFSPDFYEDIATQSLKKELGARGLRQLIERRMQDLFFNVTKFKDKKLLIQAHNHLVIELPLKTSKRKPKSVDKKASGK